MSFELVAAPGKPEARKESSGRKYLKVQPELKSGITFTDLPSDPIFDQIKSCKDRVHFCEAYPLRKDLCRQKNHQFLCALELIKEGINDENARVRAAALLASGYLGELAKDHVDAVAERLSDNELTYEGFVRKNVAQAAMRALGAYGEFAKEHIKAIVNIASLTNPIQNVINQYVLQTEYHTTANVSDKVAAMEAISDFGILAKPHAETVRKILEDPNNTTMHHSARLALGAMRELKKDDVEKVAKRLQNMNDDWACEEMMNFANFDSGLVDKEHVDTIRDIFVNSRCMFDGSFRYKKEPFKALGAFGNRLEKKDVEAITNCVQEIDSYNLISAIKVLSKIRIRTENEDVKGLILETVGNIIQNNQEEYMIGIEAMIAFKMEFPQMKSDYPTVVDLMINKASDKNTSEYHISRMVCALGNYKKSEAAASFVVEMLKSKNPHIREAATMTLKEFKGENDNINQDYANRASHMLTDENYDVRLEAIKTLGAFGRYALLHVSTIVSKIQNENVDEDVSFHIREDLGRSVGTALKEIYYDV